LHVLGGVIALGAVMAKAWRGRPVVGVRLGVDLCTLYWHFLLFVWLIIFVMLSPWGRDLTAICYGLVS